MTTTPWRTPGIIAARIGPVAASDPNGDAALSVRGLTVSYAEKPAVFSVDATFADRRHDGDHRTERRRQIHDAQGLPGHRAAAVGRGRGVRPAGRAARATASPMSRSAPAWTGISLRPFSTWSRWGSTGPRAVRPAHRRAGRRARACLDRVGMADFADRQIGQLSGGQQQRVFLARALAQDADLYLLDEPFAGVDAATERAIVDVLKA
jgi:manganese/zinc/iron transport system ATP- binding protein